MNNRKSLNHGDNMIKNNLMNPEEVARHFSIEEFENRLTDLKNYRKMLKSETERGRETKQRIETFQSRVDFLENYFKAYLRYHTGVSDV